MNKLLYTKVCTVLCVLYGITLNAQITSNSVRDDLRGFWKGNDFGASFSGSQEFSVDGRAVKLRLFNGSVGASPILTFSGTGQIRITQANYGNINVTSVFGVSDMFVETFNISDIVNRNNGLQIRYSVGNELTITGSAPLTTSAPVTVGGVVVTSITGYPIVTSPGVINASDITVSLLGSTMDLVTVNGVKTAVPNGGSTQIALLNLNGPFYQRTTGRRGNFNPTPNTNNNNDLLYGMYYSITGWNTVTGWSFGGANYTTVGNVIIYDPIAPTGADADYVVYGPGDFNPAQFHSEKLSLRVGGRANDGNFGARNWINFQFQNGAANQLNNQTSVVTIPNVSNRIFAAYFHNKSDDPCVIDIRPNNDGGTNLMTIPGNFMGWQVTTITNGPANGVIGGLQFHFYYPREYMATRTYGFIDMYNFFFGINPATLPTATGISLTAVGDQSRMDPNFANAFNTSRMIPLNVAVTPLTAMQEFNLSTSTIAGFSPSYDIASASQPLGAAVFSKSITGVITVTATALGAPEVSATLAPIYISEDFMITTTGNKLAPLDVSTLLSTIGYTKTLDRIIPGFSLSSSNTSVATINQDGLISAVGVGVATITAISTGLPGKTATFQVEVPDIIRSYALTVTGTEITNANGTVMYGITDVMPSGASTANISFSVAPLGVATIAGGVLTALQNGVVTITSSYTDNSVLENIEASVTITITGQTTPGPNITTTSANFTHDVLKVYPNPTSGSDVTVSAHGHTLKSVTVLSSTGQVILKSVAVGSNLNISTAGLAKGLYLLQIETDKGIAIKPLSVE